MQRSGISPSGTPSASGLAYKCVMRSHIRAEVDESRARASCDLLNDLAKNGTCELLSPGEDDCRLVTAGTKWRFEYRLVMLDRLVKIEGR